MHLLVADVAVLEARAGADRESPGGTVPSVPLAGGVGVGRLEWHSRHTKRTSGAGQHPRIGRAVRLVAGRAAFQPHRSMFESERPALVAVAFEAARFVGVHGLQHEVRLRAAVRIVAIHAGHGALRQPVLVGPLEAGPDIVVARGAQLVDSSAACAPPGRSARSYGSSGRRRRLTWFLAWLLLMRPRGWADSDGR